MSRADLVIRKKKTEKIRNLQGFLFAFPPVFRFLIFGFIPLLLGLAMAFFYMKYTFSILDESVYFYGFGNFKEVLKDPTFYKSILNTLYLALSWPLSMIIALIISIFLTKKVKGKTIFRVIYFLPFVCSVVATTLMWKVLLDYNYGVVNNLTELFFKTRINWAGDPRFYVPGLIIMAAWSSTGYKIILLTASLTTVNKTYYEAAELDGANAFQKIWHITFPAISPTIFFLFVTGMINVLQEFARSQVWSSSGGPNNAGLTIVFYLYREAFSYINMGKASAVAWLLSIAIIIITVINFATSKKWVKYD